MIDETKLATPLHTLYQQLTRGSEPLTIQRTLAWSAWAKENSQEDLRLVVRWLEREIAAGRKWRSALTFRRLVEDLEGWQEALSMARSDSRAPKPLPGASVLRATGRATTPPPNKPRTAAEVIRDSAAFKAFKDLKEQL